MPPGDAGPTRVHLDLFGAVAGMSSLPQLVRNLLAHVGYMLQHALPEAIWIERIGVHLSFRSDQLLEIVRRVSSTAVLVLLAWDIVLNLSVGKLATYCVKLRCSIPSMDPERSDIGLLRSVGRPEACLGSTPADVVYWKPRLTLKTRLEIASDPMLS